VIRERALEQIEQLVCTVPDEIVARLRFAVIEQPDPRRGGTNTCVVIRARRSAKGPPALELDAEAYVPAAQIPDLYLPVGATIDPPLRPSRLRELLSDDDPSQAQRVVWLAPQGIEGRRGRAFSRESLPEAAFAPLAEWVEYLVGADEQALEPWVRSALFDLDSFVSVGVEWEDGASPEPKREPKPKREHERRPPHHDDPNFVVPVPGPTINPAPAPVEPAPVLAPVEIPHSEIEAQLAALETAFCELDTPLDDPARTSAWAQLGDLQAILHRSREAGLCWSRALWQAPAERQLVLAHRWARSEATMIGYADGGQMLGIVDVIEIDLDEQLVRALAAEILYVEVYARASEPERAKLGAAAQIPPPISPELLARLQRFFATHGALLDLRTLWLARSALARLAGDDRLALFQTRDLIMSSLREGVGLARNIPNFVRTHGTDGDASDLGRLADELQRVRDEFLRTKRQRSTIESTFPNSQTDAYVRLVLAWGLARVGRPQAARDELDAAVRLLGDNLDPNRGDPIHLAAFAAYAARIHHALEGLPPRAPLSAEPGGPIAARERLGNLDRFKYDRLLQLSRVLDPREDVDAFEKWFHKDDEPFAGLALLTQPEDLAALFDRMLAGMSTQAPERVARGLGELLEYLEALPEPLAVPRLHAALRFVSAAPLETRPRLLRNAVLLAGYYDRAPLIDEALATLAISDAELTEQRPAEYAELLTRCAPVLRRSNQESALSARLTKLEARVGDNRELPGVIAQLHIAAGFAALGQPGRIQDAFTAAYALLPELAAPPPKLQQLQTLISEIAAALSRSTPGQAIAGARALMQRLGSTSDSLNTTSHFCLSVIQLMEAVVLSLASEDLALSEWARRWVEDDEHLLHRRIHADLSAGAGR
jgi:cellulose synthase operon protein C